MKTRKHAPKPSSPRHGLRLEQHFQAVEAEIVQRDNDKSLGLARQDHFLLWRRPSLFAPWSEELQWRPLDEPRCASIHLWNSFMNRHSFSSPVIITIEAANGGKRQYAIKDLTKALAVMRWYGIRQLTELRARSPGIWLIAAAALACAHEHPDKATIEHARQMFVSVTKAAGILAAI